MGSPAMPHRYTALACILCTLVTGCIAQAGDLGHHQPAQEDYQDLHLVLLETGDQKRNGFGLNREKEMENVFPMSMSYGNWPWRFEKKKVRSGRRIKGEDVSQYSRIIKRWKSGIFNQQNES